MSKRPSTAVGLLAASCGMLDEIADGVGAGESYAALEELLASVRASEGELLDKISESGLMGEASRARLEAALREGLAAQQAS